jgi:WD40 repeat protein
MQEDQNPKLLVGTRNGNIIEFEMNVVYTKNSDYEENMDLSPEDSPDDLYEVESITFKSNLLQRNHAAQGNDQPYNSLDHFNQKRLLMSVHPKESYMATIGADKFLCLWDISTYVLVEKLDLLTTPTCVKWNNDGSILVIGQNNGTLAIYEFSTNNHGVDKGKGPKMGKPQLKASQILKESDTKTSVLNIEFSSNGEYMAVSYDHQKVELWLHQLNREENEHAKNKDGSFVVVYVHKESQTRIGIQTIDPKTSMYLRYSDIRISSLNQTFENSTK